MTRARIPVIVLVVGALVAAVLLDRSSAPDEAAAPAPSRALHRSEPVVPADDVLGSTWYCAAGSAGDIGEIPPPLEIDPTADATTSTTVEGASEADETAEGEGETADGEGETADGEGEGEGDAEGDETAAGETETIVVGPIVAEHTVVITNLSERDLDAVVTIHPGTDEPVELDVELPADSVQRVALADHVDAPAAAALVEVAGGGVAVSHMIEGEHGTDVGPCASTSSDVWHFAWGDTSRDARSFVALFNPYPRDAVVDMSFATIDGVREPRALSGLVVPGESVVVADVGAEVRRRDQVSTTVRTRSGRIVAERLQSFDGSGEDGREGLTADLGVAEPSEVWVHTYGRFTEGATQRLVVANPTDEPAEVDVEVAIADEMIGGVAPFELTVRPQGFEVIDLAEEARLLDAVGQDEVELTLTVRSLNGVPVASELVTTFDGVAASSGRPAGSTQQVVLDPLLGDPTNQLRLRVNNLDGDAPADVSVVVVRNGRRSDAETVEVEAAGRALVGVDRDDVGSGPAALLVTSSSPVLVELVSRFDEPRDLGVRSGLPFEGSTTPIPVLAD